jgi:MFS family permease
MSFQQISSPLGTVLGYILATVLKKINWTHAFIVQACIQAALAVGLIFIPRIYFEKDLFNVDKFKQVNVNELAVIDAADNLQVEVKPVDIISVFEYRQRPNASTNKCLEFFSNLRILIKRKVYIVSTFSVVVLLFIVTAIQYWISDYLKIVLKIEETVITIAFVVTCVTAPTLGIILGGIVVQKYGGYEKKVASLICVIFSVLAGCCSIAIPIFSDIVGFAIFLWLFFFFGGAIVPNIVGIYLSSLPVELRGAGNSVSNVLINGLGYLPAPYIYGAIFDNTVNTHPRMSLAITVNYCWVGVILLIVSMILRFREFNKRIADGQIEMADGNKEGLYNSKGGSDNEADAGEIKIQFSEVTIYCLFLG